jgi:hypothetical protein
VPVKAEVVALDKEQGVPRARASEEDVVQHEEAEGVRVDQEWPSSPPVEESKLTRVKASKKRIMEAKKVCPKMMTG